MEDLLKLLTEYKYPTAGVAGVLALFWPKIVALLKSIKLPSLPSLPLFSKSTDVSPESVEVRDQECLRHLRDRALSIGDKDLLQMIRSVDSRFFDIHISNKGIK